MSSPLGVSSVGWNDLFWVVHPGGPVIMDSFAAALGLDPGKLAASRRVLSEYGNMMGPTLIFVLDEAIRRRQQHHEEGSCEWGFMVGLGPGFTIEVMALHACSDKKTPTTPRPRLRRVLCSRRRWEPPLEKARDVVDPTPFDKDRGSRTNETFRQETCTLFASTI